MQSRVLAQVVTVDPSRRIVEARLKDNAVIYAKIFEIAPAFRWPAAGEVWVFDKQVDTWKPISRYNDDADHENFFVGMNQGDMRLDGNDIQDANGQKLARRAFTIAMS